ncbi:MAG TPA: cyanophycin synthetase, partial [Methanosarcina sp.]|nr:cyanophycin synthetase [Methanosarcina sp.]
KLLQQKEWNISEQQIYTALSQVKKINGLHGRWETIHQHPSVIVDVGHNEDGIKQVVAQLAETTYNKLHIITGMVKDKEVEKVLSLLPKDATYYFTHAHLPRALPEDQLQAKAAVFGLKGETYPDVNNALSIALQNASTNDLILICGSVFLAGEVDITRQTPTSDGI